MRKKIVEKKKKPAAKKVSRKAPLLEKQNLQINALMESNHEFFGLADLDGSITYINRAGRMMCGLPLKKKLPTLSVIDLVPESFRPTLKKKILPAVLRDGRWQGEALLRRLKDHTEIPIDISVFIVYDPQTKQPLSLATVIRDISEWKQTHASLSEREDKYRKLIETTDTGFVILDETGHVLDANQKYIDMTGHRDLKKIKGRSVLEWTAEHSKERNTEAVKQCMAQGFIRNLEIDYVGKRRKLIPVEINATVVQTDGQTRIMTLCRDITERHEAEKKYKEKAEEIDRYFTTSLDLLCIADTNGYFRRLNPEWEHILGYTLSELIGHRFLDFVHPDDLQETVKAVTQLGKQKEVLNFVNRYRCSDGSYRWIEWRSYPQGELIYAVARDITERMTAESQREAALQASKRAKEALAQQNDALEKLNHFSIQLSMLSTADDLEAFITKQIKEIAGSEVALFSEYNPENRTLTAQHIEMNPGLLEKVIGLLGKPVKKFPSVVSDEMYREMTNEMIGTRKTLYDATFGAIPRPVGAAIQALLKVDRFIGIAYLLEGKLFGTSMLAMSKDQPDPPKYILENFILLTALSLRRRRAEEALRESEEKYRLLHENAGIGIGYYKPDGTVISYNRLAAHHMNGLPEDFIGKSIYEIFPKQEAEFYHKRILAAAASEKPLVYEDLVALPSGNKYFLSSFIKITDAHNKITGIQIISQDITERKQAEERLAKLNERFLMFGADPLVNINLLVAVCGELLGATCALYNRLQGGLLCSLGQWNTPPGYRSTDQPEGHLCNDVIKTAENAVFIVRNLPDTPYAQTDPNVGLYELKTYIGQAVKNFGVNVGSLCVVFQHDVIPSDADKRLIGIIASAIGVEEDRKRAAEDLMESEEKYRSIFNNSVEGIYQSTLDGRYQTGNPSFARMFGYDSPEEMKTSVTNMGEQLYANPEDRKHFLAQLKSSEGVVRDFEVQVKRRDGSLFWVSITARIIQDQKGSASLIEGICLDITERKKTEEALKQLSFKNEEALRVAHMGHWEFDVETGLFTFNDQYYTLHGTTAGEAGGYQMSAKQFAERYVHPDDAHTVAESIQQAMVSPNPDFQFQTEARILRQDGEPRHIIVWFRIEKDAQGRTIKLYGVNQDITERKQAQAALRESEERLRSFLEGSLEGFTIIDEQGKIQEWNRSIAEMTGISKEEAIDRQWGDVVFGILPKEQQIPEVKARFDDLIRRILTSGISTSLPHAEYQIVHQDGSRKVVQQNVFAIKTTTGYRIAGVLQDITERKRADEALIESERLLKESQLIAGLGSYVWDIGKGLWKSTKILDEIFGIDETYVRSLEGWTALIHPDWQNILTDYLMNEVIGKQQRFDKEYKIIKHDNKEERWVHGLGQLEFDKDNQPLKLIGTIRDITERKRAEEALQRSTEKIRAMFDTMKDGITFTDLNGNITEVNDAVIQMHGYEKKEEILNRNALELIAKIDHERALEGLRKTLATGHSDLLEFTFQKKKGDKFHAELNSVMLHDDQGKPIGFVALTRDITERKRAEEELRGSEAFRDTLLETMPLPFFYKDANGRYLGFNKAFETFFGQSKAQLIGKSVFDINPYELATIYRAQDAVLLEKPGTQVYESQVATAQGMRDVLFHKATLTDEHGSIIGLIGMILDITERKQAGEELRASEERFRKLFEYHSAVKLVIDPDTGNINDANRAAAEFYGWPIEQLRQMNIQQINVLSPDAVKSEIEKAKSSKSFRAEFRHRRADGSIRDVEVYSNLIEVRGSSLLHSIIHDITERKLAEKKLLESEKRYRELYEGSRDAYAMVDMKGKIIEVNLSFKEMLGYTEEELCEVTYEEITPQKWHASEATILNEQVFTRGSSDLYEKEYRKKDGTIFPIEVRTYLVKDTNGKSTGMYAFVRDITERKRAEESLKNSEERFRSVWESSIDGMRITDSEGTIVAVNDAYCRLVGAKKEELAGESFNVVYGSSEEDNRTAIQHYKDRFSTRTIVPQQEVVLELQSGSLPWVEMSNSFLESESHQPLLLSIFRDISERKRAEEGLRESEERFRTTLYSIGDGVITTDTQGIVQQMNHVAETLTGWNETDARGKIIGDIFRIFNEDTNERAENPVAAVLKKGIVIELSNHTVLEARDGKRRPIADSGAPIRNSNGEITGVVLVFNDQTERRGLQDQLLQAQKMDAIGRLAGGVAHDFNNMIGVILGYGMMLEKKIDPTDPSYKKIKSIISAAERSANLTKQLLAFARKQIIAPVPLNLNEELSHLQKMLGRLIGEDLTLTVPLQTDVWNIKMDPTQITQILTNLATNARDAIENIGSVSIETVNVKIEESPEQSTKTIPAGEYVLLTFSDTGKGMDKEILSHIFEPFFTTKPKGEGTGLGLSTVFGIVKQNNGFINVYSEPGQGTNFKIYFPRCYGETEKPDEPLQEIAPGGTETILIVEDEAELLQLAVSALEMQGYKVLGAQSPSEALSLCEMYGHTIDLLITDVVMPGMNGKELNDRIHALQPSIKSIFMSGYTADIVANRGILEAGVQFIQKPFTPALLARKVREVLNG